MPGRGGRVEDVAVARGGTRSRADAVAHDHDAGLGGVARAGTVRGGADLPRRQRDAEALDVDALGRHAGLEQRGLGLVVDAVRAADERVVDAGRRSGREELGDLGAVERAAVERQVDRAPRENTWCSASRVR